MTASIAILAALAANPFYDEIRAPKVVAVQVSSL